MVRKRRSERPSQKKEQTTRQTKTSKLNSKSAEETQSDMVQSKWVMLAVASGVFAAMNGLFAKLTTTALTSNIAQGIAHFLSLPSGADKAVEYITRGVFFLFNIASNITMWALFTRALTASPSTTKVTITNTSANFLVTALLGMIVFSERVGVQWWFGAAGMGAGCILVGMREEKDKDKTGDNIESRDREQERRPEVNDNDDDDETAILLEGLDEEREESSNKTNL